MAGRRNPIRKGSMNDIKHGNFSPNDFEQNKPKGTKPTAEKETIADTLIGVAQLVCRSYVMCNKKYRIYVYLFVLFGVSIVRDVLPFPKSPFSQSSHFLIQYFVKLGWEWMLLCTIPFIVMTSYTYSCSDRKKVVLHLSRLVVATFFWWFWTNMFQYIESIYGRCSENKLSRRSKCLEAGLRWSGFNISGHSFLLIYSVLIMTEETKPIQGWLNIRINLISEKHARAANEKSGKFFHSLSINEIVETEKTYQQFQRPVCFNFIGISLLCLIWDLMILTTAMYYHTMPENVVSGLIAILTWSVTYHVWFKTGFPPLPGEGKFKYFEQKETTSGVASISNGVGRGKK